jgi:hypothetical protein
MPNFTAQSTTSFFENAPQMALPGPVRVRLAQEGLTTIDDFADFKSDQLDSAYKNMRTSIPGVAAVLETFDDNGNVIIPGVAAVPAIPPVLVSAKCKLRLEVASIAFHYYDSINRDPTPASMNYTNVLKDFYVEFEAIISLSKEQKPDVPLLHKNSTPLKWIESFKDCLFNTYGIRKAPLLYIIRDKSETPTEADDPLTPGFAYGLSGSVLNELIKRLDHSDPLYKSDNATVYSMLEEATRGTVYASTIKPFSRKKNGRGAWLSMISSHAGTEKWEQLFKDRSKFLMNTKWNGRNYSLEKFTGIHRSSYVQLQEAASHVESALQLPSEHTRVGYLIDNLANSDPDLRAAIANVRINMNNMRQDFEATVAFLLPVDPYQKHKKQHDKVQIADANALQNKSHSKTGVDLRWHKPEEYKKLTKEQRIELYSWQRSKEGRDSTQKQRSASGFKGKQNAKKKLQLKVAALQAQLDEASNEPTLEELTACVAAASAPPTTAPATSPASSVHVAAAMKLKSILKRKRNDISNPSE